MKTLLILLFPVFISAQSLSDRWNAIPSETRSNLDHTFDFYSRMALTWGTAEIMYKYTDRMALSTLTGIAVGMSTVFLERGLYGRLVSTGGTLTGAMCFRVRIDIKDRKRQDLIEKRRRVEQIKRDFE